MSPRPAPDAPNGAASPLPVEVEVYINPDGSVTFADLEAGMLPVAEALNPGWPLASDAPQLQDVDAPSNDVNELD